MNLRIIVLLAATLAVWPACAEGPAARIWQPAPAQTVPPPAPAPTVFPPAAQTGPVNWTVSFTARNGDRWLGSDQLLARLHHDRWTMYSSTNHFGPEQLVAFAETTDGRLWCATPECVWLFDGRGWNAARSGFDHARDLLAARDGTLWVATAHHLFHYFHDTWIPNDRRDGLPANDILSVQEDEYGTIYARATNGWSRYEPEADTDAPETEILSKELNHANVREDTVSLLHFQGRDKWDQTPPESLLYSWRLDEHEWSRFRPETAIALSGLGLGRHVFQVRAIDHNGNQEVSPAEIEFNIVVPWYRETHLVAVLALGLLVSLFFAALALNRHRRLQHSFAQVEHLVAERTRQLELANQELLHSQKMTALGTLAAGIAHDFNNILSIIKGSAQIIEGNLDNPEKIRTRTARIQSVVQQGAEVVDAMLGFSRANGAPATPCDINAVVADTRRLLGDRFLHETEVAFTPAPQLPETAVPRDFVQQILLNFIFNASEAMTGRKRVDLVTQLVQTLPNEIYLAPAGAPPFILISVRDHGAGIPPEIRSRIFEPFFTTKDLSTRRGTGLGLSMAYELARKMDAGIAVQSADGAGSTFTLILPLKS